MASSAEAVWAQLLSSGRHKRSVRKTLVVMGERDTGKSTLVRQISNGSEFRKGGALDYMEVVWDLSETNASQRPNIDFYGANLAQSYNLYLLGSYEKPVAATLPYAFPPVSNGSASLTSLRASLCVMVLDWRKPWTFAPQVIAWFRILHEVVENASSESSESDRDAMQTALKAIVSGSRNEDARALPTGQLGVNLGVPIVIVLSRADYIQELLNDRHISEAQLDFVQQFLRTIAARYGAAILSTTTSIPSTMSTFQELMKNQLLSQHCTIDASTNDPCTLFVPPGWDSWSKIDVLEGGWDTQGLIEMWMDAMQGSDERLLSYFGERVAPPEVSHTLEPTVEAMDQISFLAQLSKQQQALDDPKIVDNLQLGSTHSVLGPFENESTLSMPSIVQALAEQQTLRSTSSSHLSPVKTSSTSIANERTPLPVSPQKLRGTLPPYSAPITDSPKNLAKTSSPKQTEVLHSFFQSLLKKPSESPNRSPTKAQASTAKESQDPREKGIDQG
ncbi:hypothetical protein MPSI1_000228 [Malassezia psittaci]|uniref:Dynein light intermediate chain n=1 Tax=Malassezia psittaci TaxID=1821823 RepID=A0AAF0F6N7_9BASI|nr:hypothetical protein MPSI1_000228 [Malassezia psittaci]